MSFYICTPIDRRIVFFVNELAAQHIMAFDHGSYIFQGSNFIKRTKFSVHVQLLEAGFLC